MRLRKHARTIALEPGEYQVDPEVESRYGRAFLGQLNAGDSRRRRRILAKLRRQRT